MSSSFIQSTHIKIYDQKEIALRESAIHNRPSLIPWCSNSFTLEAVYEGPEEIENRILATRTIPIPMWQTCMAHDHTCGVGVFTCLLFVPWAGILFLIGSNESISNLESVNSGVKLAGMLLAMVATICSISICVFHCTTSSKESRFREEMKEKLQAELFSEAIKTAETRINASRANRDSVQLPL